MSHWDETRRLSSFRRVLYDVARENLLGLYDVAREHLLEAVSVCSLQLFISPHHPLQTGLASLLAVATSQLKRCNGKLA